ncbi:hypothetical protein ACP275_02G180500 [Erythranthe tilingii]
MDSLPDELLFHILLHLPIEDISNAAAMVCQRWHRIIRTRDFVHAHRARHSVPGLVIHVLTTNRIKCRPPPVFVSMRNGRFDVSNFVHRIRGFVWCSCNGLILEYDLSSKRTLLITNPSTNQRFVAPPFPPRISNHNMSGIAYSPASMEYKVVHTYYDEKDVFQCAVLTVDVDDDKKSSWRRVCTRHLSPRSKTHLRL